MVFLRLMKLDEYGHQEVGQAKKSGNPLVVRGGYNCRHQWSYVNPDWYDKTEN